MQRNEAERDAVAAAESRMPQTAGIPTRDARILDFEREWWRHAGAKEEAIRQTFSLSAARYYQLLNIVIDTPDALRYDPMLVGRLLRARDARTAARASRTFAAPPPSDPID